MVLAATPARRRHSIRRARAISSRFANAPRRTTTRWNTPSPRAPSDSVTWVASFGDCWWVLRAANTRPAAVTGAITPQKVRHHGPVVLGSSLRPSSLQPGAACAAPRFARVNFFIRWKKTAMRATTFPFLRRICLKATPSNSGPISRRPAQPSGACATTASCWPLPI